MRLREMPRRIADSLSQRGFVETRQRKSVSGYLRGDLPDTAVLSSIPLQSMEFRETTDRHFARNLAVALAIAVLTLWFLHTILGVILLVVTIGILAIVLNAPVTWLVSKG